MMILLLTKRHSAFSNVSYYIPGPSYSLSRCGAYLMCVLYAIVVQYGVPQNKASMKISLHSF